MATTGDAQDETASEITRRIPIPTSVSPEAQQYLSMARYGGLERPEPPPLDDHEAWRAQIKATNDGLTEVMEAVTAGWPVTAEETTIAGVHVFVVTPGDATDASDALDAPIYLDIHGGGFTIGGGETCRGMAKRMALQVQLRVYSVDYRMPPDHPYPAAVDDCVAVYRALLETHPPERIIVGGASAGGNLAAAAILRARDEGLPLPAGLILQTPEADLTEAGDTFQTLLGIDNVLTASLAPSIALYADGHDLTDPYLSPLFGDYTPGYPPTLLQSGTRDLFLSNTVLLHRKLRAAGVEAELHVWEAMPHGGFWNAPEDEDMTQEIRRFIAAHLDR